MINIIIIICHLTLNETLNEPRYSTFMELMYLLETLIEHSSHLPSGRMWSHYNKSPAQNWGHIIPILCLPLGFNSNYFAISLVLPFCYSAENFMNVQFTSSSRSLTKLLWMLTPGSPPSASLPLGASLTCFSARPDCESRQICSYHTYTLHVKTKAPELFHAISDGSTFSLLPTPVEKKNYQWLGSEALLNLVLLSIQWKETTREK